MAPFRQIICIAYQLAASPLETRVPGQIACFRQRLCRETEGIVGIGVSRRQAR